MSRRKHQIIQNDVRYSALPASEHAPESVGHSGLVNRLTQRKKFSSKGNGHLSEASAVGLYKTRGEGESPNDVRVLSNGCSFFITEAEYRRRECQPFFEDLPWHEASDAKSAGGAC